MKTKRSLGNHWTIHGTAQSAGGTFEKVTVHGEGKVTGDIQCAHLKVMGTFQVDGALFANSAKVMGTVEVAKDWRGDHVHVLGEMKVRGDCNVEKFKCQGSFNIGGLLNAGAIELSLYGDSSVLEIGGETIRVKPSHRWRAKGARQLTVDTVEGDHIVLYDTVARVVRGNDVEIGSGCDVKVVEYRDNLRISNSASVGVQTQTGLMQKDVDVRD
ncbi:hypothetical protein AAC03nite_13750 [Alicyclobacillus acidoterrestris]|uniref:polymer-forming cytoskeletal protein n=1 Tax=Alicyclobacillus suci TaxID=2816080 RepID=UPI00118EF158|nr:polymer-forming cytoskeletal protein [Alicyclobacillus suci]GEO25590.1 hypothetical protein AAC03nite_13750 [Alicyclobacillus acidoterrestris]